MFALPCRCFLAARFLRKPTILDLQEHNQELTKLRSKTRLMDYLTRSTLLVGLLENVCVRCAKHTWVVVPERMKDLPAKVVAQGRVIVVGNTVDREEVDVAQNHRRVKGGEFTLIFVGLLRRDFGLVAPFVRAVGWMIQRGQAVRLLLGGVEGDHKRLDDLVEQSGAQGHVQADGIIEPGEIPRWLQQGDLGIIPYEVTSATNVTISNKLFHYLAAGLPVLSTAMKPTQRIIEELKCGAVIPKGSGPEVIAEIILRLKDDREELEAMGRRAQQAVKDTYNWEVDLNRAFQSMEGLLAAAGPPRNEQVA